MSDAVRHYTADELLQLADAPRGNLFQTPEHYWKQASYALQATLVATVLTAVIWPRGLPLAWCLTGAAFLIFCIGAARRDFVAARYVEQLTPDLQEAAPSQGEGADERQ